MAAPVGMRGSEEKPRAFTLLFSNDVANPARSKKKALKLMYLIHKYSRENLLLANIYIKVNLFYCLLRSQIGLGQPNFWGDFPDKLYH